MPDGKLDGGGFPPRPTTGGGSQGTSKAIDGGGTPTRPTTGGGSQGTSKGVDGGGFPPRPTTGGGSQGTSKAIGGGNAHMVVATKLSATAITEFESATSFAELVSLNAAPSVRVSIANKFMRDGLYVTQLRIDGTEGLESPIIIELEYLNVRLPKFNARRKAKKAFKVAASKYGENWFIECQMGDFQP